MTVESWTIIHKQRGAESWRKESRGWAGVSARELKCAEVRERLDERRANEDRKIKGEVKMRAKNKQGERESSAESKNVCVGEGLWSCSESCCCWIGASRGKTAKGEEESGELISAAEQQTTEHWTIELKLSSALQLLTERGNAASVEPEAGILQHRRRKNKCGRAWHRNHPTVPHIQYNRIKLLYCPH